MPDSKTALRLLDVQIDNCTREEALKRAGEFLNQPRLHHIVTPEPEFLLEASAHPKFLNILNQADLSLPDGMGLHVAALASGQRLRQRIPGADFVDDLMELAAKRRARVFLFGGLAGAAHGAAVTLIRRHPKLDIVGAESGYRGPWQKLRDRQVLERIHRARPDILFVALGAPKQELWIDRHRQALHQVRIAMGVGRTLDYLAGLVKRPPKILRRTGLEWMDTYLRAGSYYQGNFRRQRVRNATWHFVVEVLKQRVKKK